MYDKKPESAPQYWLRLKRKMDANHMLNEDIENSVGIRKGTIAWWRTHIWLHFKLYPFEPMTTDAIQTSAVQTQPFLIYL